MTADPKYHDWFTLGAQNFRAWAEAGGLELPEEPVYPCPLCLPLSGKLFIRQDLYDADGALSIEDVPPDSVGGKKICLTCKSCNNKQGSKIDSHSPKREKRINSQTGGPVIPVRARHTVGGVSANVDVYFIPDGAVLIAYAKDRNDPRQHQAYIDAVNNSANGSHRLQGRLDFNLEAADLSWVRAAYLAAFTVFGWEYALRPAFLPLLRRLAGKEVELHGAILRYDETEKSKDNHMLLVTEPGPQQDVLIVQMARATVVLPGPGDNRTLDEVADAMLSVAPSGEVRWFDGKPLAWPTRPKHLLDPDPVAEKV